MVLPPVMTAQTDTNAGGAFEEALDQDAAASTSCSQQSRITNIRLSRRSATNPRLGSQNPPTVALERRA
jgi:hypothetical protein